MPLILSLKVHPAAKHRLISGQLQRVKKSGHFRMNGAIIDKYAGVAGQLSGKQGHAGRHTQRAGSIGLCESHTFPCQPVQMGCAYCTVPHMGLDPSVVLITQKNQDIRLHSHITTLSG